MTGSGTLEDPYVIWDVNDLQAMENELDAYYELGQDIAASETHFWNEIDGSGIYEGFIPIGQVHDWPFEGQLDGKDYTISDLFINGQWHHYQALFMALIGTIQNVNMTGASITGRGSMTAALVGYMVSGQITNCHVAGAIEGLDIFGEGDEVGGLVGYLDAGIVEDCSSAGMVTGIDNIGGLVGRMRGGGIIGCNSSCDVTGHYGVGGLVGLVDWFAGAVWQSYATGSVNADSYAGGFLGINMGDAQVNKCYATGSVTISGEMGGGFASSLTGSELTTECYATGNVEVGGDYGGGFVGVHQGNIGFCYARGDVVVVGDYSGGFCGLCSYPPGGSGYIYHSYSTGAPTSGNGNLGGFNGKIGGDGEIEDCFWDKETSGIATSDGGIGKTTTEMKTRSTFTDAGWDFATYWGMYGHCNNGYPCLQQVTSECIPKAMAGLNPAAVELLVGV